MLSRAGFLRLVCAGAAVSSAAANSSAAAKSQSVKSNQQSVALDISRQGPPQGPRVEYHSLRDNSGWYDKQFHLKSDLQESKNRLYSNPEKLKRMLNTLIVEATNDKLYSADGFELQVELDPLIEYVCKKLDITDAQVITDFKEMMGAELQKYTKNYGASYLPNTIEVLSMRLIATLEKK